MDLLSSRLASLEEGEEEGEERVEATYGLAALWQPEAATEDCNEIWPAELDAQLWSRLPSELLLDFVFSSLPFFTVLRLRVLSRACHARLSSPAFWRYWFRKQRTNSVPPPQLLLFQGNDCPVAAAATTVPTPNNRKLVSRWRKSNSICFVPSSSSSSSPSPSPTVWCRLVPRDLLRKPSPSAILCCNGGLFVVASTSKKYGKEKHRLYVCNPMNRSFFKLPKLSDLDDRWTPDTITVNISVDVELGTYTIVCVPKDQLFFSAQVYRSGSWVWETIETQLLSDASKLPPMSDATYLWSFHFAFFNHTLLAGFCRDGERVFVTDFRISERAIHPNRPLFWRDAGAGWSTIAFLNHHFAIFTWKMESQEWVWTRALPQEVSTDFLACPEREFLCVKVGDCLFLSIPDSRRVFIYHLESMKWRWSRTCPYAFHFTECFAFQPRPDVEVSRPPVGHECLFHYIFGDYLD